MKSGAPVGESIMQRQGFWLAFFYLIGFGSGIALTFSFIAMVESRELAESLKVLP